MDGHTEINTWTHHPGYEETGEYGTTIVVGATSYSRAVTETFSECQQGCALVASWYNDDWL